MTAPAPAITETEETDATDFAADWRRWHQQRLQALSAPHGFLAVTDLHWLTNRPHTLRRNPRPMVGHPRLALCGARHR